MKKRSKEISSEFEKILAEKGNESEESIVNQILIESKKKNEECNKLFFEEKMKHYRIFKNSKSSSKKKEWKSILNLRTHSKKVKKRGRKSKKGKNSKTNDSIYQDIATKSPSMNKTFDSNEIKVKNDDYTDMKVIFFEKF